MSHCKQKSEIQNDINKKFEIDKHTSNQIIGFGTT